MGKCVKNSSYQNSCELSVVINFERILFVINFCRFLREKEYYILFFRDFQAAEVLKRVAVEGA